MSICGNWIPLACAFGRCGSLIEQNACFAAQLRLKRDFLSIFVVLLIEKRLSVFRFRLLLSRFPLIFFSTFGFTIVNVLLMTFLQG